MTLENTAATPRVSAPFRAPVVPLLLQAPEPISTTWNVVAVPGEFKGHPSGPFELTESVFKNIIQNFKRDPLGRINVDQDHLSETLEGAVAKYGAPAPAWVTDLKIEDGSLVGKFEWCDADTVANVRAGKIRYLSPAITFNAVDPVTGEEIGARLSSVALTNKPFLREIPVITASEVSRSVVLCRAVPYHKYPVADGAWDADGAVSRLRKWASKDGSGDKDTIDWSKYERGFALVTGDGDKFSDYHLPHEDIRDGELVTSKAGVAAALAALHGARGGMSLSSSDKAAAESHLEAHRKEWAEPERKTEAAQHAPGSMVLQTIIVSKLIAASAAHAKSIASKYGKAGAVDETGSSYRYRQRDPSDFQAGSFRTIAPGDSRKGVSLVVGKLKTTNASLPVDAVHVPRGAGEGEMPDKDDKDTKKAEAEAEARRMEAEAEARRAEATDAKRMEAEADARRMDARRAEAEGYRDNPFVKKMRKLMELPDAAEPDDIAEKVEQFIKDHKAMKAEMAKRMESEAEMRVAARVDGGVIKDDAKVREAAKALCLRDPSTFDTLYPEPPRESRPMRMVRGTGVSADDKALLSTSVMPRNDGARSQTSFGGEDPATYEQLLDELTMKLADDACEKDKTLDRRTALMSASSQAKRQLAGNALLRVAR